MSLLYLNYPNIDTHALTTFLAHLSPLRQLVPQTRSLPVLRRRNAHPILVTVVDFLLKQIGYQARPACLMACTKAHTGLPVEEFVEQ